MKRMSIAVVPLAVIFLCSVSSAQVCIKGRPTPECKTVLLIESSFAWGQRGWQATSEFGGIYNLHRRHALGASAFLNVDYDKDEGGSELGMGFKARYRYWLGRSFSIDVAPGVLVTGAALPSPGFYGHVALNYTDWLGLIGQVDRVNRSFPEDAHTNYSAGIKVGSYAGVPIMLGVSLLLIYAATQIEP